MKRRRGRKEERGGKVREGFKGEGKERYPHTYSLHAAVTVEILLSFAVSHCVCTVYLCLNSAAPPYCLQP